MKTFLLFLILLIAGKSYSTDHYYYFNQRIDLTPRTDRLIIIFKDAGLSKIQQENEARYAAGFPDEVKEIAENMWMANYVYRKPLMDLKNIISSSTGRNENIKFITLSYFGESPSVIQLPADEFFVRLTSNAMKSNLDYLNSQNDCFIAGNVNDERGFLIKTGNDVKMNALEMCEIYRQSGIFEFVEPNFYYADWSLLHFIPNDPFFPQQWNLRNTGQSVTTGGSTTYGDATTATGIPGADMDLVRAWDHTTGNSSIIIGVVDTGIDSTHSDLVSNMVNGYDAFFNTNGSSTDAYGHGTPCAGIIAAVMNNSIGVAGIAPSCKLMSLRIFNASGSTNDNAIIRAFDTARVRNVDVLSNSWGGGTPSAFVEAAINNVAINGRSGKGGIILFSSGNDGRNPVNYPSYLDNVVSVGASTPVDIMKSPGSGNQYYWGGNYGESITGDLDVVAPTVVYSTATGGGYTSTFNGTSASCPNAAGVAALILSVNTNQTRLQVYENLYRGSDKIDNIPYDKSKTYGKWNDYYGYGRVNAYNSVRLAAGVDVTPPTINHSNVNSHSSTYPTSVSAEIIDQNGSAVPTSGINQPKLFFRVNKNNMGWSSFDSVSVNSVVGNIFTFKIPGFGYQTEVQYYIRARDASGNQTSFPKHASVTYPYTLCYYAIGSISEFTEKISGWSFDNSYSNSPMINIGSGFSILDVMVRVYLRHTWINDLHFFTLWSPSTDNNNNRKQIWGINYPTSVGTPAGGINGSLVTDSSSNFWKDGFLVSGLWLGGDYKPDHPFHGLKGTNSAGNWRFTGRDAFSGDPSNFDSIRIYLKRLDGTLSPNAQLDNPEDSTVNFGSVTFPSTDTLNFYLKNTGNSNLNISGVNFTGTYAHKYSLAGIFPPVIAPNDSGLFKIRLQTDAEVLSNNNLDNIEGAVMEISNNDPSKPVYKVSLQTDNPLPVELASFSANIDRRDVHLNWMTASEINNSGFNIERKTEGSESWMDIGFINGNGTTNEAKTYSFTDRGLNTGIYNYRLKQVDYNGNFEYYNLSSEVNIGVPDKYELSQNYPNPFNPTTKINFDLPFDSKVTMKIFDITGREIATLVNEVQTAGYYTVTFDARNIASGMYFYRIVAEGGSQQFVMTKKMLMLK